MNKQLRTKLSADLEDCQTGAKVRLMTPDEVIWDAKTIETWLRRKTTPVGTGVHTNWKRVANSYKGIPAATFVTGRKAADGICLEVHRGNGFGNRAWTVSAPDGHIVRGPHAHPSGSTDDLLSTVVIAK